MGIQGQILEITVVGCQKLKDTEWISRQDPYVCLEYGGTRHRTRTCTDGGKNPTFQEKFMFTLIEGLRDVKVAVWNSNTLTTDDFIGNATIPLQKVLSQGYEDCTWTLQTKTGRYGGEVRLIMHFEGAKKHDYTTGPSAPPYTSHGPQVPPYSAAPPHLPASAPSPYASPPPPPYSVPPPYPQYPPTGYPPASAYAPQPSAYPPPPPSAYPPAPSAYPPAPSAYPPAPSAYPPSYPPPAYPPQASPYYPPPGPYPGQYPPPPY
ncbi:PREDICTED: protein SRC2 homolog isoform X2 [Tarenaya hassleriana]|uniref:protein SRC2 homolog isoform X2 n=1 Tax=Tarenaya hassleriana TaxID=28532 RepID=UPI00053C9AE6|nr:PREDICTED: protein SRC2 homolog isoform X2 [Tarenaya hassleriana]